MNHLRLPTKDELLIASTITKIAAGPFLEEILKRSRRRITSQRRGIAMYVIRRELDNLSTTIIGKLFGLDHSTVIHWLRCVENNNRLHAHAISVQREFEQMKPIFMEDRVFDSLSKGFY